jgi:hypothetical protein
MSGSLTINRLNGDVVLNGFVITKNTLLSSLPAEFAADDEIEVIVLGEKVPCRFAHATVDDSGRRATISLRFERDTLVSIFCQLPRATEAEHLEWLREKLGPRQGHGTAYRWGVAGVGVDKSGDVFIFLHNAHNTWARG